MKEQIAIGIRRRRHKVADGPQGKRRSFQIGNPSSPTLIL